MLRVRALLLPLALVAVAAPARGSDIGEALQMAAEVMGDEIIEGYEDFVDNDPNEALSLLLSRDVRPGRPPEEYFDDDEYGIGWKRSHALETLGDERLSYAALSAFIAEASRETGLPVALIDAVIRTESGYRTRAVSRAGARGLMQLMPGTAREVGVKNAFDARENILGGARYLRRLYDQFGNVRLAVAAYNAGPSAVKKHGGVPPFRETKVYVETVLRRYQTSKYK